MKKIGLLIGLLGIFLTLNTLASCIGLGECNDTRDYKDIPDDFLIDLEIESGNLKVTDEEIEKYGKEQIKAYYRSFNNGITTKETFQKANIEGNLTRIEMAKILSQYAINILGKVPANSVVPNYSDISSELDETYNNGVSFAYQLGIMGIGIKEFRPFDTVTRAEFATALSRMLYGPNDSNPYYAIHLLKLKVEGIINNVDPNLLEKRGYIMLMLMRLQENKDKISQQNIEIL